MRVSDDKNLITACFVDDIPKGYLLSCGSCETQYKDYSETGEVTLCPSCNQENVYRPWYEW